MVLAASIVGSGELIATTTLGAQTGFTLLWMILLSCAIKPVVQAELGRYTIVTGHTGLEGLDSVPGPRLRRPLGDVGMGRHGRAHAPAGRRHVRRRLAGAQLPRAGDSRRRLGRRVPRHHARAPAGRRLRAHRTVRVRQGRPLHPADGVRRGDPLRPAGSDHRCGSGVRPATSNFPRPVSPRRSPSSASPAWARPSSSCTRTGASKKATRASPARATAAANGRARARGWIRVMHLDIVCSMVIYTLATARLLSARRERPAPDGRRALGQRHDQRAVEHLHADARAVGVVGVLSRAQSSRCTGRSSPRRRPMHGCLPMRSASRAATRARRRQAGSSGAAGSSSSCRSCR